MSQTKILIMAGGQEKRWGNYLGVHKHFVEVEGEHLIHRTIRQLQDRTDAEISIVAFNEEYATAGVKMLAPIPLEKQNGFTCGIIESAAHLSKNSRTIVLLGDVFFTDEAMDSVCSFQESACTFFGREKRSKKTGCPWGEIFGFTLLPEDHSEMSTAIEMAKDAYRTGHANRCSGWEVYRALNGLPLIKHKIKNGFVEINDFTDDFDFPLDYERWLKNYNASKLRLKQRFPFKWLSNN